MKVNIVGAKQKKWEYYFNIWHLWMDYIFHKFISNNKNI
jgi:hypothetical protein